ncbi:UTRA domain-containing protein [Fulvimarina endophytica]|uniref:UTRA domain-containing protein n=1 Tax=Fulvimarina endophytica TaxID=2293836 RepID=A0A371WYX3_9HYPH|nr:UTRA domain-containing protein [Fulvimarina endophytica]RFC62197.1 UTRA domain-containing protein [Fulvimarina endophytica]
MDEERHHGPEGGGTGETSAAGTDIGSEAAQPRRSLHQTILESLKGRILSGEWPPGTQVPFEQDLARRFGCSRMTVNKVMTQLAAAGLVERRRKAGTFVRRPQSQTAIMTIMDIRSEVESLGLSYHYEILSRETRDADGEEARWLGSEGRVVAVTCRHFAARQPFCFEDRLINLATVPEAARESFRTLSPGAWLVSKVPWSDAEYRIRAIAADEEIAGRLLIKPGSPCLRISRRTMIDTVPVTSVTLTYPGTDHEVSARFASQAI